MQKERNSIPATPRFGLAKYTADQFLIAYHANRLPFQPEQALKDIGCKIATYTEFARLTGATLEDVADVMGSDDGRAVFWKQEQYIVFINDTIRSAKRMRWTLAHELSHILLRHMEDFNARQTWLASNGEANVLDREANACASELLSPAYVLYKMNCRRSEMISEVCNISYGAARIRQNLFDNVDVYLPNRTEARLLPQFISYMRGGIIA